MPFDMNWHFPCRKLGPAFTLYLFAIGLKSVVQDRRLCSLREKAGNGQLHSAPAPKSQNNTKMSSGDIPNSTSPARSNKPGRTWNLTSELPCGTLLCIPWTLSEPLWNPRGTRLVQPLSPSRRTLAELAWAFLAFSCWGRKEYGCGSEPMVPFWGRCTTHVSLFFWDWDVHWGYGIWAHAHTRRRKEGVPHFKDGWGRHSSTGCLLLEGELFSGISCTENQTEAGLDFVALPLGVLSSNHQLAL